MFLKEKFKVEQSEEESQNLLKEQNDLERNIEENDKVKDNISLNLEKNMKIKKILKKILFKFISNTQMKEIRDLQIAYTSVANDKRELEVKNKKYQEFLNSVLKEKEEKDAKIQEQSKELDKTRKKLSEKDKKLIEAEKKIRELEVNLKDYKNIQLHKSIHKNSLRAVSKKKRIFYDDTEISTRKYLNEKSKSKNTLTNSENKVPIVTATLHGGNFISNSVNNLVHSPSKNLINQLKTNLNIKNNARPISKSPNKKIEANNIVFKRELGVNLSKNNLSKFLNSNKISTANSKSHKDKDKELVRKELNKNDNNKDFRNNLLPQNNIKTIKSNSRNKYIPENKFILKPNDSISISAVTFNNEVCANSSELEIMENVLILDGINNKNLTPMARNIDKQKINFFNTDLLKDIPLDIIKTFNKSKIESKKEENKATNNNQEVEQDKKVEKIEDKLQSKIQDTKINLPPSNRVEINLDNTFE
jgi:hypothetical protein